MLLGYTRDVTLRFVLHKEAPMLVVISDLHLTDGTTGTTIAADAFTIFAGRVRDMAFSASWRNDGTYRPLEKISLVLLGDIFDHLLTTQWVPREGEAVVNPWDDPFSPAFVNRIRNINRAILEHNAESFRILRRMSEGLQITLPPATRNHRPAYNAPRQPVPVGMYYMVGNHDWYFHLPGNPYDAIRAEVARALGLQNAVTPFPHEQEHDPVLHDVCLQHGVYLRHGDIYDGFNYNRKKGRNAATLGDAIVVGLVNRFPVEVQRRYGDELPPDFISGLSEIANVRPNLLVPVWIDSLMRKTCSPAQQEALKAVWDELADAFLSNPFVRAQDTLYPADRVDFMQAVLRLSQLTSLRSFSTLTRTFYEKFWDGNVSFKHHALKEQAVREGFARYVVYGHTHIPEIVPLDVYPLSGTERMRQIYFNSGTWHTIHDMVLAETRYAKFVPHHTMTFLAFFREDERKGRPYETWTGALGWKD